MKKYAVIATSTLLLTFGLPSTSNAATDGCPDTWVIDTNQYPNQELANAKKKLGVNMAETIISQNLTQFNGELGELPKVDNLLKSPQHKQVFYYLYGKSIIETTVKVEVKNCPIPRNFVFKIFFNPQHTFESTSPWQTLTASEWAIQNPQSFRDFKMQENFPNFIAQRKLEINEMITKIKNNQNGQPKFISLNTLRVVEPGKFDLGAIALTDNCVKPSVGGAIMLQLIFGNKCDFGWLVTSGGRQAILEPFAVDLTLSTNYITCIKGKTIKKVSGTNPKCPTGYKKAS